MRNKLINKINAILDENPELHPFVNINNFSNDELLDLYADLRIDLYLGDMELRQLTTSHIT